MGTFFGTDGIRGPVGGAVVNPVFFEQLGRAVSAWLLENRESGEETPRLRIVFGRDSRPSGPELTEAFIHGLDESFLCLDLGILPTPALARFVQKESAALGVVITASHNPASDNGIKIFTGEGAKLSEAEERRIEGLLQELKGTGKAGVAAPQAEKIDGVSSYLDSMSMLLPPDALKGWKVALDTANGATRVTSSAIFRDLGADLIHVGDSEDGSRINDKCGSEHPETLIQAVLDNNARLGFAHDGDGDRLVCVDERGQVVNGDQLIGLIALDGMKKGWLKAGKVVTTVQSNGGLDQAIRKAGGQVYRTPIGDRWVAEKMAELGVAFGGENSGHLIFGHSSSTGDGLLAALMIVDLLKTENQPLSELAKRIPLFPQATNNLKVKDKIPLESCVTLQSTLDRWRKRLGEQGRILIRYSGTESKLRILAEAPAQKEADEALEALVTASQKDLALVD